MNLVKIEAHVDASNPNQVLALSNFLTAIGGNTSTAKTPVRELAEEIPALAAKKAKKVEAIEVKEPEEVCGPGNDEKEEPKKQATSQEEASSTNPPSIMEIRSLVSAKAAEHKDDIKATLVKLGAANVSTLDPKHFSEFFTFLSAL
jgi:hypothetical protein